MAELKRELFDLEKVFDEEISPLMKQVKEICARENMPMVSMFCYTTKDGADGKSLDCGTATIAMPSKRTPELMKLVTLLALNKIGIEDILGMAAESLCEASSKAGIISSGEDLAKAVGGHKSPWSL